MTDTLRDTVTVTRTAMRTGDAAASGRNLAKLLRHSASVAVIGAQSAESILAGPPAWLAAAPCYVADDLASLYLALGYVHVHAWIMEQHRSDVLDLAGGLSFTHTCRQGLPPDTALLPGSSISGP